MEITKQRLRVLIVEDNRDIAENIGDYLEARGHITDYAMDGLTGLHLVLTKVYDVMILDVMLPGMDGLTLCRKYRESNTRQIPVLMLTARDALPDKLSGFESGADDYLVKPFALQELSARIHALLKRHQPTVSHILKVGDLELDTGTLVVKRAGKPIEINRACVRILEILLRASPNVVSKNELEHQLWGDEPPGSDALRSHMYTLRNKIDKPFSSSLLKTIHGLGYKLAVDNEI